MAERKTYTDEQKADALKKVQEIGITKAAKELGISVGSLLKWRADAGLASTRKKATAAEIEVKKNARAAGRKAKSALEKAVEEAKKASDDAAETVAAAASVASDEAAATEIEVKKKTRGVARKAKETAEKVAADVSAQAAVSSVEIGKTVKKAERKVKEKIEDKAAQLQRDSMLNIVIQSNDGHAITALQISKMVPAGATDCYVKAEENKLYYVLNDGSTGSVNIW